MKKIVLACILFIGAIGIFNANAQKNKTKKSEINPIGIECDKIYVSVQSSGVIKFSNPVNLINVGMVDKVSSELVENLWFKDRGCQTTYKTIDLHGLEVDYDLLLDFEIIKEEGAIIMSAVIEPCSRQIVIGHK